MSECVLMAMGVAGGVLLLLLVGAVLGHRERMEELRNARPDQ